MKNTILLLFFGFLSLSSLKAQNTVHEMGFSGNLSLMNSDFGLVPGVGFKLDNRINFATSNFVIKNSLGLTSFGKTGYGDGNPDNKSNKSLDYLWMFDAILEYNFKDFSNSRSSSDDSWTPYIGGGINSIYRSTKKYGNRPASEGMYFTLKGSLGAKFRINNNLYFTTEGYLEWDFSDELDGFKNNPDQWYKFDHTANFSIGIMYKLGGKGNTRLPWADNLL